MEEIEYLEEYEDLILPMSFTVDDGKSNDGRKSIDSLEMLYKDLIEDNSHSQNQADTSPFSLNPQMVSPEKTILSSTVEVGLPQSVPNYSLNTTPSGNAGNAGNASNVETLNSYQAQTSNIQYLNRLTSKSFSTYSSLQKPDKLKSVATVKPTLQRVPNPPKQSVQMESSILKSGQPVAKTQHSSSKTSSMKATFEVNTSSNLSRSKSSMKISKISTSGVDPLAGLNDDELLDFDEKNDLVNGFDFESDLDNSIIAGLSEMDSDSVDLSDEFIDDNFDLESDLSSEESDPRKTLKRRRSQLKSQDSSERQNGKSLNDLKRDISSSVKKKLAPSKTYISEGQQIQKNLTAEKLTATSNSSVGKDLSFATHSTKVSELVANGSSILPQLSSKLNELDHADVSNVLNLTPTVPLYTKTVEKPENTLKLYRGTVSNEKCAQQKKDNRTHVIIDPFRGFEDPPERQTAEAVKDNSTEQHLHKSSQKATEMTNQKVVASEKSSCYKFGSLYLRSIRPPLKKAAPMKTPANTTQPNPDSSKTPVVAQSVKVAEENCETPQKTTSSIPATKNTATNNPVTSTVSIVSKTLNSLPPTPQAIKDRDKRTSVPSILEAKGKESIKDANEPTQLKRNKSLGSITVKDVASAKPKDIIEKVPQTPTQLKGQKVVRIRTELSAKKDIGLVRMQEGKQRDSIAKLNVQIQSVTSLPTVKIQEGKNDDLSDMSKVESQPKHRSNVEEIVPSKLEKTNPIISTQEPRVSDIIEKLRIQIREKLNSVGKMAAAAAIEMSSATNVNETTDREPSQSKAQTTRCRFAVERNRNKSIERTAEKIAPETESNEKDERQMKTVQRVVGDKRLEAVYNGNGSAEINNPQQKINKSLISSTTPSQLGKIPLSQGTDASSSQRNISLLDQEKSIESSNPRKRKFKGFKSKLKETPNLPAVSAQSSVQATVIPEKAKSIAEPRKLVLLSPERSVAQRDSSPKVPINVANSTQLSSNTYSKRRSAKFSRRLQEPMSPRNSAVLEQRKQLKLRRFKICLDRKTVDHFIKSLKVRASNTPQSITKGSSLGIVKSPPSNTKTFPRPVGRPRKIVQSIPPPSSVLEKVDNTPQPPVDSSSASSVKVAQDESKSDTNSLVVQLCPSLRKRKRKKRKSNQLTKVLRTDAPPSADKSNIPNKETNTDDRVSTKEAGGEKETTPSVVVQVKTAAPSIRTACKFTVPTEAPSGVPSKVISPIASSQIVSPNVSTIPYSPTFPTDAASPATPIGASDLEVPTATSVESAQRTLPQSPKSLSPSFPRKRGRPSAKKSIQRAALARRLELIRASTSQRLPSANLDQICEDPTPEPVSIERPSELANECTNNEDIETVCPQTAQPPVSFDETVAPVSAQSEPPDPTNEMEPPATPQPTEPTTETARSSRIPDGACLGAANIVQPKIEIGDMGSGLMFDGAPTIYSFSRASGTGLRYDELLLDACQIDANSFSTTEHNDATESVSVYELPSYIVMRTRIITRSDLQNNKSAIPPQVKETINKLAENGHVEPVVKEEQPDFKDICLEINALLGRNANYLKFASGSERQARMNQVLSDSTLSVQEAQSALKFLQSYLSALSKKPVDNNAKGQQFIPIYDSQKKVIGYRKRRVQPKNSSQSTPPAKQSTSQPLNRNSNSSTSRTASTNRTTSNETLSFQATVGEFTTKTEPEAADGGDEELIVPDASPSANAIKSEDES